MSSTPSPGQPNSPLQSEKSKRYDRQLRLWGDHGQAALERSSVCLVTAGALGTELLKSLVLPGLGSFTILDPGLVTEQDLGNNFFLSPDSLGRGRAEVATRLLLEMNHEVRGEGRQETVEQVLAQDPNFFSCFSLVVGCSLSQKSCSLLSSACWTSSTPLLVGRTSGLLGYLRLQLSEHLVTESHPDTDTPDLRLDQPWPALTSWLDGQVGQLDQMSLKDHGHTPYPALLHKELGIWRAEHGGNIPGNYKEKKMFKQQLLDGRRRVENNPDVFEDEENFEEAAKAVNTVVVATKVPEDTMTILNDPEAENISTESHNFWILANALREFVKREGRLPVSGVIPDMFSDSERYIQLQNIFRDQAGQDTEMVGRKVGQVLDSLGRSQESVSELEVRRFCKEARWLRVQRGSKLEQEFASSPAEWLADSDQDSDKLYYLVLRAVDSYHTQFGVDPGLSDTDIEVDISRLKTIVTSMLGSVPQGLDEHIHEVCRYGGAELHSVAAFLGGAAAHECIKLLTGQFVPIDNTLLYNAVTSNVTHFKV